MGDSESGADEPAGGTPKPAQDSSADPAPGEPSGGAPAQDGGAAAQDGGAAAQDGGAAAQDGGAAAQDGGAAAQDGGAAAAQDGGAPDGGAAPATLDFAVFLRAARADVQEAAEGTGWAQTPGGDCATEDLTYMGVTVREAPDGSTCCVGVTLEAFFKAYRAYFAEYYRSRGQAAPAFRIGNLTSGARFTQFFRLWYVSVAGQQRGAVDALAYAGILEAVDDIDDAREGDFVQYWTPAFPQGGHSVIFVRREGDRFRYWSSQRPTNGPGERTMPSEGITAHVGRCRPHI